VDFTFFFSCKKKNTQALKQKKTRMEDGPTCAFSSSFSSSAKFSIEKNYMKFTKDDKYNKSMLEDFLPYLFPKTKRDIVRVGVDYLTELHQFMLEKLIFKAATENKSNLLIEATRKMGKTTGMFFCIAAMIEQILQKEEKAQESGTGMKELELDIKIIVPSFSFSNDAESFWKDNDRFVFIKKLLEEEYPDLPVQLEIGDPSTLLAKERITLQDSCRKVMFVEKAELLFLKEKEDEKHGEENSFSELLFAFSDYQTVLLSSLPIKDELEDLCVDCDSGVNYIFRTPRSNVFNNITVEKSESFLESVKKLKVIMDEDGRLSSHGVICVKNNSQMRLLEDILGREDYRIVETLDYSTITEKRRVQDVLNRYYRGEISWIITFVDLLAKIEDGGRFSSLIVLDLPDHMDKTLFKTACAKMNNFFGDGYGVVFVNKSNMPFYKQFPILLKQVKMD
jgi:hypothetical protein